MNVFVKITAAEQARLDALIARTTGALRRALDTFLRQTQSDETLRRVIDLLERHDLLGVMQIVDRAVSVLGNTLPEQFAAIGASEADALNGVFRELADQYENIFPPTAGVGVGFNPTHEAAALLMQQARLEFIQNYGQQQREVTRQALVDALRSGEGPRGVARAFRDTMGLTPRMEAAIDNYERLLRSTLIEALHRDLRDRRYDRTVRRAVTEQKPLTEAQIQRMVDRYRQRMKMYRSEMIARTETTRVLGEARDQAVRQAHSQAGIPDNWVWRKWHTSLDGRERPSHHEMHGQEVQGMDSYFMSPSGARLRYPGDSAAPAEEVINCRCTVEIIYRPPAVR